MKRSGIYVHHLKQSRVHEQGGCMKPMHALHLVIFVSAVILGTGKTVAQPQHVGGFGGTEHGPKQCPDHVIGIHGYVGVGGEGGVVVTQLGFTCADGEHEIGTFGPPKGTYFQIDCNPGDAANGIGGRSGKYLDAIGLWCKDPRGDAYVAPVTVGPFFGMAGGGGGTAFNSMKCGKQGEIPLIGLDIWSGANVDGVEPICNPTIGAMWSGHLWTWNTQNHPENGGFTMSVRFTKENGQWKMYVVSLSADIGESYALQQGQIGSGAVSGNHATLMLPIHGAGYVDVRITLNLSTDAIINPPGVPAQSGSHSGNELDMVGQGPWGNDTFWAAFRGSISAWPQ
jgi:hypothetical protein